jgi:molecular chaperone GrpE
MDTVEQGEKESTVEQKVEGTSKDEELAIARKQAEEYKTLAMYLKADLENYKKRSAREKEEFARYANESLIMDLLDVYENLERALSTARGMDESMAKGLEMIYSSMKSTLEKHGLRPIKTVGEKFDPFLHEAVMQAVDNGHEDGTILEEIQRGYTLNMKVIRCAKVKVSKRGE